MSKNDDMIKLVRLFEATQFAGEPEQKPGDQVRGTDKAVAKGKQHPFHNRLVGEEISLEDKLSKRYQDMKDVQAKEKEQKKKQELDEQGVAEGERTMSRAAKGNEKYGKDGMRALAQAGREGASEKKLDAIRDRHDKYDESVEEASLSTMRDYYAGDTDARDKTKLGQMRDYFSKIDPRLASAPKKYPAQAHSSRNIAHVRTVREQDPAVDEGFLDHPGQEDSPVAQAITRRILLQRTDLLSKHGPEKVMMAIDEVADFVGDVEEIGSSDVSGWVRHVEQMLGNMEEGVTEGVAESVPMADAAKVLRQYGAGHFKTTSNELHFYKNGRPFSIDLIFNDDATRSVSLSQLNAATRRLKGQGVEEAAANPADKITLDVPLMIRIMEYAREDAQDDVDLHNVAEQLVRLSSMGKTLGMNDYNGIVGQTTEQKLSELGAVPPTPPTAPTPPATANAAATSGSVSPDEQTALNKIQTTPAMKQQFDKLMTQATPGAANKPATLDPAQADALEKLKTNAGLKSQYDRLIKQANPAATP
jgi:hypothetical protein